MGQNNSHKHYRSDPSAKNFNANQHVLSSQGTSVSSSEYNYSTEDHDEEETSYPTIMSGDADNYNENKKIPVVFKYSIKNAKDVCLIGTFTSWKDKIQMVKSDGDYVTICDLPEGEHQYKFVVDGKWEHDPNQATVDDHFNGKNNIVNVKKSDFEVMDALATDQLIKNQQAPSNTDDLSKSPPGEYSDELPVKGINSNASDKPPFLPPQLLNIVLNKDTPAKCEPTLLPEPNHVMLKHLYALSIRDGVMVLSSTFRYKQKFVTTCFYKPIQ